MTAAIQRRAAIFRHLNGGNGFVLANQVGNICPSSSP
jgi:hypothetical protein